MRHMPGGDKYRADAAPVRLKVVDVNNLGLCLNGGLSEARGKYYVQLDSDDRLKPDAIEKILKVYDSDPTIGMVVGSYEVSVLNEQTGEIKRDERVPVVTHDEWTDHNGRNNLLRIGGAGAPRSAHIKVIADAGWFGVNDDPYCRNYGEDYDLVLRISERYKIGRVWEPIYEVIRHSGGTDHSIDQSTIDRNDSAKDAMRQHALRRRRQLNGKSGGR
jgi:glycosyltransferase involved in cell wall biosynthesis